MGAINTIKVLLVDDHEMVRTGLRMLLETQTDIDIVGEASNAAEALLLVESQQPAVVVMDITLPDVNGIEATRKIKNTFPSVAVVALTIHEDEQYFFEMLQAGASGYVPKRAAPDDLLTAIRTAYDNEIFLYPSLAKTLVTDFINRTRNPQDEISLAILTEREQEVLEKLAEGYSNEEIAEALTISKHTVARHRENIMRKLELHSRSDLVKYAIRKGLIQP